MAAANLQEFWVTKPADQAHYTTLEFYNANAGLKRFVTEQTYDIDFELESGAPRNPDETVTFQAVPFTAPEPEQGEDGEVTLNINLGAIGIDAKPYIKAIHAAWPPTLDIVWRKYLSGITKPVQVFYFQSANINYQDVTVEVPAEQINSSSYDISETYKGDRFPGLRQSI